MGKKILWILLALIVAVGAGLWLLFSNLDAIVASMIETEGSRALGTEVRVSGVTLDLAAGKAGISDLTIANPEGFSSSHVFDLEAIEVDLAVSSLGSDTLIIDAIDIGASKIVYELKEDGSSNVQALLDGMPEKSGSSGRPAEGEVRLIIDRLNFAGSNITVISEMEDVDDQSVDLPSFDMQGIGRPDGASGEAVAKAITVELAGEVIEAAARAGLKRVIEKKAGELLDKLKGSLGDDD